MHGSSLTYAWLSDGTKVAAKADDGSGNGLQKRYVGSFVFTSDNGSSSDPATEVESIAWDEGRITYDGSSMRDCWFAGDHLGNVRTVIDITTDMDAPEILEQSDYLPFGTKIQNSSHASWTANRWRYAAKEEQRFGALDLSLLDFGIRLYDSFTARWTAVDPLANKFVFHSPFLYCAANPINNLDLDGMEWEESDCFLRKKLPNPPFMSYCILCVLIILLRPHKQMTQNLSMLAQIHLFLHRQQIQTLLIIL